MSSAELAAYEAHRFAANGKGWKPLGLVKSPDLEGELHQQIKDECKRRGWQYFCSQMNEATKRQKGEPDFTIMADGGRTFYVECKTQKGKLSPEQLIVKAVAAKLGHTVHLVRNIQEFMEAVKKLNYYGQSKTS